MTLRSPLSPLPGNTPAHSIHPICPRHLDPSPYMNGDSSAPCSAAGFGISASCADSHRKAQAPPALLALRGPTGPTPSLFSSAKDTISPLCRRVSTPFPLWRAAAMWAQPREGGATQVIPAQPVQRRTGGRSPHRRGTVLPPETAFCPFSSCRVGRKPVSPAVRSGETPPSGCRFSSSPTVGPLKRRSARLTPPALQKRGPFPVGRALSFFVFSLYSSSNWPV